MSNYFFGNLYTYHYKSHAISSHVHHYVYKFKGLPYSYLSWVHGET